MVSDDLGAGSGSGEPRAALTAPTPPTRRVEIIDVVRGFALFGVLLSNMVWTSQFFALTAEQRAALPTADWDRVANLLQVSLVSHKFYTLFSVLFGLGFALQLTRAAGRGERLTATYLRRLTVLLVFGVLHGLLLWFGDILHLYALLGFVLFLFRDRSERTVLAWCAGVAALTALLPFLNWLVTHLAGAAPVASGGTVDWAGDPAPRRLAWMTSGSWNDLVRVNWDFNRDSYTHWSFAFDESLYWILAVFWKFLLGFAIGRRMLLQHAERHLGLYRRILLWGLVAGVVGHAVWLFGDEMLGVGVPDPSSALASLAWVPVEAGILGLSAAYLSLLVLLHQRPRWRPRLGLLAPVGRMALTNYLAQSVFMVALFYGVGLGLLGEVGEAACHVLSLVLFTLQIVLSGWWLRRFRFGPAEWLWRSLTYGTPQRLRLRGREERFS